MTSCDPCSGIRLRPTFLLVCLGGIVLPWWSTWYSSTIAVSCICPIVTWNPFLWVTDRLDWSCSLAHKTMWCLTWHFVIFRITAVILDRWIDERKKHCPQCVRYLEKIKGSVGSVLGCWLFWVFSYLQKTLPTAKHKKITAQPPKKTTIPKTTPALKILHIGSQHMELQICFTSPGGFERRNYRLLCNALMFHKKWNLFFFAVAQQWLRYKISTDTVSVVPFCFSGLDSGHLQGSVPDRLPCWGLSGLWGCDLLWMRQLQSQLSAICAAGC